MPRRLAKLCRYNTQYDLHLTVTDPKTDGKLSDQTPQALNKFWTGFSSSKSPRWTSRVAASAPRSAELRPNGFERRPWFRECVQTMTVYQKAADLTTPPNWAALGHGDIRTDCQKPRAAVENHLAVQLEGPPASEKPRTRKKLSKAMKNCTTGWHRRWSRTLDIC
jgi:predicted aldo/keto reductase-like oxidoreductase